tara:strand:+ start:423 stop:728 length:306 start_codon:yes stop_codon:yes gene_type:complete
MGKMGSLCIAWNVDFRKKKKATRLILLFKSGPRSDFGTLIRQYFALLFSNLPDITAKDRFEIQAFTLLYFDPKNIKLGAEIRGCDAKKRHRCALKKTEFPK